MIRQIEPRGDSKELIATLKQALTQESKNGRPRKSSHAVWGRPDILLDSWKFNDWDYYGNKGLKLVTNARGLFTRGDDRIVIRGYDKFFNASTSGEVSSTKWDDIERNTVGPYYVTLKENGCIVFISGLEDGTLVVCSKHSTGPRDGSEDSRNHSWVAQQWVDKHLARVNKTRQDLAKRLFDLNVTAVGELCDDDFEEHVLAYNKDESGIYLHGLNVNCPDFVTYGFDQVTEIANEFGFIPTKYVTKNNLAELRQFLDSCAETGSWGDRQVEGFVIRTKRKAQQQEPRLDDFFFKYKFEEPYLMYRQWRELTKKVLSHKDTDPYPAIKKHVELTRSYLDFAIPILRSDTNLREAYLKNHGIIAMRQRFLDSHHLDQAKVLEAQKHELENSTPKRPSKVAIFTVSTIGCGKTTTAVALQLLTGWAHVQSDDFQGNRKKLLEAAAQELKTHDVVIIDRNNQSRKNREQIMDEFARLVSVDYVCMNFLPQGVTDRIRKVTEDRVADRGDNHQSIREMPPGRVKGIMSMFYKQFEPVTPSKSPDSNFDHIINLDAVAGSLANVTRTLEQMRQAYPGLDIPEYTNDQIKAAVDKAIDYQPAVKPVLKKNYSPYYFGVNITPSAKKQLVDLIERLLAESSTPCSWWASNDKVMIDDLHVTLAHVQDRKISAARGELFKKFKSELPKQLVKDGQLDVPIHVQPEKTANLTVTDLMFNDRIMALQVDVDTECANTTPHITIAKLPDVQSNESNQMLISGTATRIPCQLSISEQPICVWLR